MKFTRYWLALIIFLTPLIFVPSLFDVYSLPKIIFLVLGVLIGWVSLLLSGVLGEKNDSKLVTLGDRRIVVLPLLLLAAFAASSFLQPVTSARVNSLSGLTAVVAGGALLAMLIGQVGGRGEEVQKSTRLFLGAFVASALVLAITAILQYADVLAGIFNWEAFSSPIWTPTGSFLATILLIVLALVYVLTTFLRLVKSDFNLPLLLGLLVLLIVLALGVVLLAMAALEADLALISFQSAWVVAVEGFKSFTGALFGSGPGNFQIAYARFRPVIVNNTDTWTVYFASSFGQYLQLLTEAGLLGLVAFGGLVALVWRQAKNSGRRLFGTLPGLLFVVLLIGAAIVPFDVGLWLIFFVLLGLLSLFWPEEKGIEVNQPFLLVVLVALLVLAGWWYGKAVWADCLFARSLGAFSRGEGGNTYNWQLEVLEKNPHRDVYHLAYAQTNLALADTFAKNEDLTEQDQQQITILIQQAIQEGKNAVAVNPLWANNWASLAGIYRQIIGTAQGADQWATDSLGQAIILDPVNPTLRIDLGGLFFALGDFDSAQRQFEMAVNLKPDRANAHYNLAAVYKAQEKWQNAALELQTVLSLVEPESSDFDLVKKELAETEAKLPKEEPVEEEEIVEEGERLQQPQPLPEPQVSPIELPEEESAPPDPLFEEIEE
jgi:tetratricopeptide (TPR) repeat protein